jgi:hypothetical protein
MPQKCWAKEEKFRGQPVDEPDEAEPVPERDLQLAVAEILKQAAHRARSFRENSARDNKCAVCADRVLASDVANAAGCKKCSRLIHHGYAGACSGIAANVPADQAIATCTGCLTNEFGQIWW